MEKITKLLILLTIGFAAIILSRLFYFYPNLLLPFWFTIIGYLIYKEMIKHKQKKGIHPLILTHIVPWIMIIGIVLLYEGHGINFSANMISHFLSNANQELISIVYHLDEILSHILIFAGLFTLFFAGAILQINRPFSLKMGKSDELALGVSGVLFGLGLGTALLESNIAVPGLIMSLAFLPGLLLRHWKHKLHIVIRKYPLNYYIAIILATTIILLLIYYFAYGGFLPPSEILCGKGYESACTYYSGIK